MIGFIAPFFLRVGLGEKAARLASWGLVAFLIAGALGLIVLRIRGDAVRDERARVALIEAAAELAQRTNERIAGDMRQRELADERRLSDQRRREIDDATRHIPDQVSSPRQRAVACTELRRQDQTAGLAPRAC